MTVTETGGQEDTGVRSDTKDLLGCQVYLPTTACTRDCPEIIFGFSQKAKKSCVLKKPDSKT